jgi:hypothetical protein
VRRRAALFRVRQADGRTVVGYIHGSGGVMADERGALERAEHEIRLADRGSPLHVYEPETGHCLMYVQGESGPGEPVDLRGATVEVVAPAESAQTEILL